MFQITTPGIYPDVPTDAYFADPCPEPSFTQSLGKIIIERSARHARQEHPRLAPPEAGEEDDTEKYVKAQAIGNAAHAVLIGRGKSVAIGPFDKWTTKEAKAFKAEALEKGLMPILTKHHACALDMVKALRAELDSTEATRDCFTDGHGEVMLAWQEDGLWFRSLVDWLHADLSKVDDLKTTAMSAAPHAVPMKMVADGWDVQAAMIERGLDVLDPAGAGRRRFRFICQENKPPYAATVNELPESTLTMGRKKLEHAIGIWRDCMRTGRWPAYPLLNRPQYPGFKENQWLEREVEHEERRRERPGFDPEIFMAG